jgi:dTDP-glucose 4,6-dehydratase
MVVHFAAETHVDRSIQMAEPFAMTNVVGTQVLLDCCRDAGISRFIHISTDEVYGSVEHGVSTEESPLQPNSPYAASKASSDLMVRAFYRTYGLPAIITRCANNYGPYQFPEKLIPRFITDLFDGANVPLYGDGLHIRDWIHVEDHCRAILLVLESGQPGEIYNIGGATTMTNMDLTRQLLQLCGVTWDRVTNVSDRKGHDRRYALDDSKIRRELGYVPLISFEKGLADTVRWYQDNRQWWESQKFRDATQSGSTGGVIA